MTVPDRSLCNLPCTPAECVLQGYVSLAATLRESSWLTQTPGPVRAATPFTCYTAIPASRLCSGLAMLPCNGRPCLCLTAARRLAQYLRRPGTAGTLGRARWAQRRLSAQHAAGAWGPAGRGWRGPRGCTMAADWRPTQTRPRHRPRRSGLPAVSGRTARRHRGSLASRAPATHSQCSTIPTGSYCRNRATTTSISLLTAHSILYVHSRPCSTDELLASDAMQGAAADSRQSSPARTPAACAAS